MDEQQHESAGSSSAVEQHHTSDTMIRSRRYATDVTEGITAPSDPSASDDYELKEQVNNEPVRTPESPRHLAGPPPLETSESATPEHEPEPGTETKPPEEKQCRICLAGAEEEAELGRLISPCLCRGSIRYVHVNCLKQWRTTSQSRSAFWSCPQCGFKYALARTRAVGLANSPVILSTASMMLFTIIVLLSSFLATYFVPGADALNEPPLANRRDSDSFFSASFGGVVISPFDYYTYSWDTAKDVFKLAVRTFSDLSNVEEEYEFWKRDDGEPERDDVFDDSSYEKVHTSGKGFKSTVKVPQKGRAQRQKSTRRKPRSPSRFERFVRWFIYRFMTGLGVVVGLIAPLRLFGGNWARRERRATANDTVNLVIVVMIIIGVARAIWLVYKLTRHIAQLLLRRAETAILEVGQVEEDAEPEAWGPYLKRVVRELPARLRTIPYRLLPSIIFGWVMMALVQGWHAIRNWTRDAVGQMIQVGAQQGVPLLRSHSKPEKARDGTTQGHKRNTSRRAARQPENQLNVGEDTTMDDQARLDMRAADECMDQAHIRSDPAWKVFEFSEEDPAEPTSEDTSGGRTKLPGVLENHLFWEEHNITFLKICPREKKWLDLGPAIATIEAAPYASAITVRTEGTLRVLATWSVFGGMKVIRFLSTVIVVAIVPNEEGGQAIVSTLEKARDLAVLISSPVRGLQINLDRRVPRASDARRARFLAILSERLTALQQRLVGKEESELSILVELELASMLSAGIKLAE
ncbi:unnamed protein product [Rhizoctonia solani]|uniref:RING-CH-type domain-containing protein n=1 Tax=Rhizoctonia solani TaxID=456999 RepID=A0A8H3I2H9_9AGAM|nr:unnamed protein product [Rhizoctonia solani]